MFIYTRILCSFFVVWFPPARYSSSIQGLVSLMRFLCLVTEAVCGAAASASASAWTAYPDRTLCDI